MNKDEKILELMSKIYNSSRSFCEYVEGVGNQCALTDRYVEEVIEASKDLNLEYNKC